jgi:glycosyltransferase involved in cell wall biosynthesis
MSEAPLITVVIAYHGEPVEFVQECLDSMRSQTFRSWECILVNDGFSNEGVTAVVQGLDDSRFTVVHHERNRGLGAARNTGIRAAKAPLIALLDDDDWLDDSFLDVTYGALADRPDADWVVVDWKVFGTKDEVWPFPIDDSVNCPAHFIFVGSGVLMRKSVWDSIGGYSEDEVLRGGEDWDFWISAAERGLHPIHVRRPLYNYRMHPDAMTVTTARSDSHLYRKAIYRRHKIAFQSMGLDCELCPSPRARVSKFLAQGLAISSDALMDRDERARAIGLAGQAFLLQPRNASFRRHFARSLVTRGLRSRLAGLRNRRPRR